MDAATFFFTSGILKGPFSHEATASRHFL